jgi:hypothetical protein
MLLDYELPRLVVGHVLGISGLPEIGLRPDNDDFGGLAVLPDLRNPFLGEIAERLPGIERKAGEDDICALIAHLPEQVVLLLTGSVPNPELVANTENIDAFGVVLDNDGDRAFWKRAAVQNHEERGLADAVIADSVEFEVVRRWHRWRRRRRV